MTGNIFTDPQFHEILYTNVMTLALEARLIQKHKALSHVLFRAADLIRDGKWNAAVSTLYEALDMTENKNTHACIVNAINIIREHILGDGSY